MVVSGNTDTWFYATQGLLWFALFCYHSDVATDQGKKGSRHIPFCLDARTPFLIACAAFIGYVFLSTLWSIDRAVAWQHAIWIMEAFLLFFMIAAQTMTYGLRLTAYGFISGTLIQSILGIWQFLTQSTFSSTLLGLTAHPAWAAGTSIVSTINEGRWLRTYGAFPHPNMLGGYLVMSLIIVDLLLLKKQQNTSYNDNRNPKSEIRNPKQISKKKNFKF